MHSAGLFVCCDSLKYNYIPKLSATFSKAVSFKTWPQPYAQSLGNAKGVPFSMEGTSHVHTCMRRVTCSVKNCQHLCG